MRLFRRKTPQGSPHLQKKKVDSHSSSAGATAAAAATSKKNSKEDERLEKNGKIKKTIISPKKETTKNTPIQRPTQLLLKGVNGNVCNSGKGGGSAKSGENSPKTPMKRAWNKMMTKSWSFSYASTKFSIQSDPKTPNTPSTPSKIEGLQKSWFFKKSSTGTPTEEFTSSQKNLFSGEEKKEEEEKCKYYKSRGHSEENLLNNLIEERGRKKGKSSSTSNKFIEYEEYFSNVRGRCVKKSATLRPPSSKPTFPNINNGNKGSSSSSLKSFTFSSNKSKSNKSPAKVKEDYFEGRRQVKKSPLFRSSSTSTLPTYIPADDPADDLAFLPNRDSLFSEQDFSYNPICNNDNIDNHIQIQSHQSKRSSGNKNKAKSFDNIPIEFEQGLQQSLFHRKNCCHHTSNSFLLKSKLSVLPEESNLQKVTSYSNSSSNNSNSNSNKVRGSGQRSKSSDSFSHLLALKNSNLNSCGSNSNSNCNCRCNCNSNNKTKEYKIRMRSRSKSPAPSASVSLIQSQSPARNLKLSGGTLPSSSSSSSRIVKSASCSCEILNLSSPLKYKTIDGMQTKNAKPKTNCLKTITNNSSKRVTSTSAHSSVCKAKGENENENENKPEITDSSSGYDSDSVKNAKMIENEKDGESAGGEKKEKKESESTGENSNSKMFLKRRSKSDLTNAATTATSSSSSIYMWSCECSNLNSNEMVIDQKKGGKTTGKEIVEIERDRDTAGKRREKLFWENKEISFPSPSDFQNCSTALRNSLCTSKSIDKYLEKNCTRIQFAQSKDIFRIYTSMSQKLSPPPQKENEEKGEREKKEESNKSNRNLMDFIPQHPKQQDQDEETSTNTSINNKKDSNGSKHFLQFLQVYTESNSEIVNCTNEPSEEKKND